MDQEIKTTTLLEVYEPAMCCSTGVCGPDVDDKLITFAQDVRWLESEGVTVKRYNLAQEPEKFKEHSSVLLRLQSEGSEILPILLVNGEIISEGGYPDREQLKQFLMTEQPAFNQNPESHTEDSVLDQEPESHTGGTVMDQKSESHTEESALNQETASKTEETGMNQEPATHTNQTEQFTYSEKVAILVAIGASVGSGCERSLKTHFSRGEKAGIPKEYMVRAMQSGLDARQVPMSDIVGLANKLLGHPEHDSECTPGGGCC